MKIHLMARYITFALLTLVTTITTAQDKDVRTITLTGHVLDSFTKAGITAKVTLMSEDSIVLDTMTCTNSVNDATYTFYIQRTTKNYIIKAEHEDFETTYVSLPIKRIARNLNFNAPWHYMKRSDHRKADKEMGLKEVVVKATKVKMTYKGDTIVFNADAFNVPEGSMLSSIIKQLPNTEITEDGEIYVNGRKIDELTLNGEHFYKGKNKVMLDNLPYYVVKDISVYEKQTDESKWLGRDVAKKNYVMNVSMKKEYRSKFFGNAEGGIGTEDRYLGRLFAMNMTDHTRLSAFGLANNFNDLSDPDSEGSWGPEGNSDGEIIRKKANLDYLINDKEKRFSNETEASLNVFQSNNKSLLYIQNYSDTKDMYGIGDNNQMKKDVEISATNRFKMENPFKPYRFSSVLTMEYTNNKYDYGAKHASMNWDATQYGNIRNILDSIMQLDKIADYERPLEERSLRGTKRKAKDLSFNGNMLYQRKLGNGDNITIGMDGKYQNKKPYEDFTRNNKELQASDDAENKNLYNNQEKTNYYIGTWLKYSIVLNGWTCTPTINFNQSYDSNLNQYHHLEWLRNGWDDLSIHEIGDLPCTEDSLQMALDATNYRHIRLRKQLYTTHLGLHKLAKGKTYTVEHVLNLSASRRNERMTYEGYVLDTVARRGLYTFQANYTLSRRWDNSNKMIYIYTNVEKNAADMTDMIGETDMSDPESYYHTNKDLKGRVFGYLYMYYYTRKPEINQQVNISATLNATKNKSCTRSIYDRETGITHFINDNIDGNWSGNLDFSISRDLGKAKHFNISNSTNIGYTRDAGYAMAYDWETRTVTKTNTESLDQRLTLRYTLDKLTVSMYGRAKWRYTTGNISDFETLNRVTYNLGMDITYTTPFGMGLATDIKQETRRGYSTSAMNTTKFICNASISQTLTRKKNIILTLVARDIFKGRDTWYELFNGNNKIEVWLDNLPNYYMAKLQVKF